VAAIPSKLAMETGAAAGSADSDGAARAAPAVARAASGAFLPASTTRADAPLPSDGASLTDDPLRAAKVSMSIGYRVLAGRGRSLSGPARAAAAVGKDAEGS
jgi:hypothetical protein